MLIQKAMVPWTTFKLTLSSDKLHIIATWLFTDFKAVFSPESVKDFDQHIQFAMMEGILPQTSSFLSSKTSRICAGLSVYTDNILSDETVWVYIGMSERVCSGIGWRFWSRTIADFKLEYSKNGIIYFCKQFYQIAACADYLYMPIFRWYCPGSGDVPLPIYNKIQELFVFRIYWKTLKWLSGIRITEID